LAKIYPAHGDVASAKEIYIKVGAVDNLQPWVRRIIQISLARLNLSAHNIEKARIILPKTGFKPLSDSNASETTSAELRAQILDLQIRLAEDAHEDLVSLGKLCVKRANSLGIYPLVIEALCTCALASSHALDGSEAHRTLKEALDIARRTNCAGVIIFFPLPGLRQMLNELAAASMQSGPETVSYIRALLERKPGEAALSSSKAPPPAEMVPSLLTQKERQVLGLLAVGYSNQKMADTLMVSLATIKWHVRNILSKLVATNRSEAVAKARLVNIVG
jgi:LuxR family maltose regulon positive regulatory protein